MDGPPSKLEKSAPLPTLTVARRETVHVPNHPLAQSFPTDIRDKESDRAIVRSRIRSLSVLLFYEATRDLPRESMGVTMPLAQTQGAHVGGSVGLAPILRAGLEMVDGILEFLPEARV